MIWKDIKDKILTFGEDDYVFADMFISIVNTYTKVNNKYDLRLYTFMMLEELMSENLIKVFTLHNDGKGVTKMKNYDYVDTKSKQILIKKLDSEWEKINYNLPSPNELFWITADLSIQ